MENIKAWVMDETAKSTGEDHNWKHELGRKKSSDSEMLRTFSTGLLAVCLAGYAPKVFILYPLFLYSFIWKYI